MGQAWASLQDKLQGRQWKEKQVRKITDKVFDRLTEDTKKREQEALTFEEVYIAVLCVYNDINKYLPGPHYDPPSKEKLKAMMNWLVARLVAFVRLSPRFVTADDTVMQQEYDINLDGLLDREEFAEFIRKLTAESLCAISFKLLVTLVAAPALALATKRATEGVPGVGRVVRKVPNSIYASVITLGVVMAQKSTEGVE
uniref:EF-hand domain-containing protein n=1 Tax=Oryza punctata TaxID=4537 RepID=A0A0E0KUR2_ORYPU